MEMLSLRIHLPSPPPLRPPLCCYHDNIDCSLKLKQQGRSDPLSLPPFLWHTLTLLISQSVSSPFSFHRGEGKVGHNPKNKSPTKTLNPSACGSQLCVIAIRRDVELHPAFTLSFNTKIINIQKKNN